MSRKPLVLPWAVFLVSWHAAVAQSADRFCASGPTAPEKMQPHQKGVVQVRFDLLPTSMRFNAPSYPCLVTENGIEYCNGFAETYAPAQSPKDPLGSFEPGFDDDNEYSRMWIESQNDARIIVRVRGALVSDDGKQIAHVETPSNSPYGRGDWVDEWYYIYPDGTHTRHVKIYTGLASRSLPFGFDREPPRVVHEFMEAMVLGRKGRTPEQDIQPEAITLIKTVGEHSEQVIAEGKSRSFVFSPYPRDFGEFSNANILIVNLKARYRPFTIGMPYGVRTQPYTRDDLKTEGFQVWGDPPVTEYTVSLGHMINYAPYRKTENTIEQVYLSGMMDANEPAGKLVALAWSWIVPPKVSIAREGVNGTTACYDPAQKAYLLDCQKGDEEISFELVADPDYYGVNSTIVNPVLVVKQWGRRPPRIKVDDQPVELGAKARFGYELTDSGTNLVIWLQLESTEPVNISLRMSSNARSD